VGNLSSLSTKMPPLASSIQQLCTTVRTRVSSRRASVEQRSHILNTYDRFYLLVKELGSDIDTVEEFLSDPSDSPVTMDSLDTHKQVMERLNANYSKAKLLGELN